MSTDCNVHQMLFNGTFFSIPHMECPYACCFKSDSDVNHRFSSLYTTTEYVVSDAKMINEVLNRPSAQSDVAYDDSVDKNLGSNDVAREERHHRNGLSKSKTQGSSFAYSPGKKTYIPIDALNGKNSAFLPDIHTVKRPHSLYPNPQHAIEKPGDFVMFYHLLSPSVKQDKTSMILNDAWNKRLPKPQYTNHDESNSLSSGSSSPISESFDTKLSLNDDSASCSGDSSGDFEHNGRDYHNGGERHYGGEDRNDKDYIKVGDQYRMLGQQKDNLVPQSAASMNMLQRDAKLAKKEVIYCPICFKKLKHIYYLRRHMIIHSGVKPFKCNFCPRRFSQTGNRNAHMRIHTGEKPFQCDLCNKKFTHASSKRRHTKFCQAI
ncbi:zinc finger protein 852-like [Actinia tenebrosa]|uniref:Zinc finger protein 852-like n=1 Tax=Actinia tenebrosa TaxID=6105 RepID=A0A6P8I397_ACTTE|nr:zinc finger protein 852-like [Actinia tenebrosa]